MPSPEATAGSEGREANHRRVSSFAAATSAGVSADWSVVSVPISRMLAGRGRALHRISDSFVHYSPGSSTQPAMRMRPEGRCRAR
jgi:hypothetical protein